MAWIYPFRRGSKTPSVPWVPSRDEVIEALLEIIKPASGDTFYDIGCGDGRVAVEVAKKYGIRVKCIELRQDLIERGIKRAQEARVENLVEFINDDFFQVPISDANIVYMYLLTSVNMKLRPKLEKELQDNTIVISLDFPITGWTPVAVLELTRSWQRTLYLYVKGLSDKNEKPIKPSRLEEYLPEDVKNRLNISLVKKLARRGE